jgi:CheY-like chemotaxis protein
MPAVQTALQRTLPLIGEAPWVSEATSGGFARLAWQIAPIASAAVRDGALIFPPPDVVLAVLRAPMEPVLEALQLLRHELPEAPMVVLTDSEDAAEAALLAGATSSLTMRRLTTLVHAHLQAVLRRGGGRPKAPAATGILASPNGSRCCSRYCRPHGPARRCASPEARSSADPDLVAVQPKPSPHP